MSMDRFIRMMALPFKKTLIYSYVKKSSGDWRFIYLPLAWRVAGWLVPRRKVSIGGISFTLPCDNWVTHFRWYLFKGKEPEIRMFIDEHVRDGDVFFDIGANIGVFSQYAMLRHPLLMVHSFEPEYSNLHVLKQNLLANNLAHRAHVHSVAISDRTGLSTLHIQDTLPGSACHTESAKEIATTDEGLQVVWREGVACMTLDDVCDQLGVFPNAIKVDTDGNELKILRGAARTLRNFDLRCIVLELSAMDMKECVRILEESGFQLAWSEPPSRNFIWVRG